MTTISSAAARRSHAACAANEAFNVDGHSVDVKKLGNNEFELRFDGAKKGTPVFKQEPLGTFYTPVLPYQDFKSLQDVAAALIKNFPEDFEKNFTVDGHSVEVKDLGKNQLELRFDGAKKGTPATRQDNGSFYTRVLPYQDFASLKEMAAALIKNFPDDFS
jgi:hypothetical protein